jgi:hypothetical protein
MAEGKMDRAKILWASDLTSDLVASQKVSGCNRSDNTGGQSRQAAASRRNAYVVVAVVLRVETAELKSFLSQYSR